MMGKECIGFITNESEFALGMALAECIYAENGDFNYEELAEALKANPKTDSMGMDTIVYFPNIQMPDKLVDSEDDSEDEYSIDPNFVR